MTKQFIHIAIIVIPLIYLSKGSIAQNQVINQNVISTAGNRIQNNNIILDWTLGEMAVSTLYGSSKIISQGFHQPRFVITSTGNFQTGNDRISVYPNPTQEYININMKFDKEEPVIVNLIDESGKLLWEKTYFGQIILETISLQEFSNGTYFMGFYQEQKKTRQTFKIQKIN